MNAEKRDRVWAPDPIEGYVLGYVTDVGGDSLTVETADNSAKVKKMGGAVAAVLRWKQHKNKIISSAKSIYNIIAVTIL